MIDLTPWITPAEHAKAALDHLIQARDAMKAAGASKRMLDRIRSAISSARGAVRHAGHRLHDDGTSGQDRESYSDDQDRDGYSDSSA